MYSIKIELEGFSIEVKGPDLKEIEKALEKAEHEWYPLTSLIVSRSQKFNTND